MKDELLAALRRSGDYVSGQELCETFGVSRTAVWKAVEQLKKEGYEIEAVRNRGYRLLSSEVFGEREIAGRLSTVWLGRSLEYFEEIGSTNVQANLRAEAGGEQGLLVVADHQTAGRGRRGRSWGSPAGCNLYFSILLRPQIPPERAPMLTLLMAVAVNRALEKAGAGRLKAGAGRGKKSEHPASSLGIKWPNDIVIDGRKVCGILTEMSAEQDYIRHVVIGTGINIGKQTFPADAADHAIYLEEVVETPSRVQILSDVCGEFEGLYEQFLKAGDLRFLQEEYNRDLVSMDKEVRVLDPKGEYTGISRGINEIGELLVERPGGAVEPVYAGEVSVRGIYGYV